MFGLLHSTPSFGARIKSYVSNSGSVNGFFVLNIGLGAHESFEQIQQVSVEHRDSVRQYLTFYCGIKCI